MHKFYSEPVAALDLRLTKSEASLFGMESNPLDLDVKMDEEQEPKEEIPIPVDYPEVQVCESPPLSLPVSQPPPTGVAEQEEEMDPRVMVESPWGEIQHVTLHIARSPHQCGVPASPTPAAWSQTQVERVSSSSYPTLSTSPLHHLSNTGLAHRHPVIEEWRGLGVTPSNLWLFPRTHNQLSDRNERETSCPGGKQWSLPENPLTCPPFLQECMKPSDSGYPPTCYPTNLNSHSPPLLPKFPPLPGSYYTPDGFQPQPKRPEYLSRQQPPLSHPHSPTNHPPRQFTHKDFLPQRGSVIVHHPPMFQRETETSSKFHSGGAIHPSPVENLAAHSIKQEDLSQSFHNPPDELKQEPEDLKSPQWLSKIQQLRTDFAFQVLEARRRQGCEQEQLYYPPTLQLISQLSAPREPCLQPEHIKDNPGGGKGALDLVNTFLQRMEHPGRSTQENLLSSTTTSPSLTATPGLGARGAPSLHTASRLGKRGRPRKHAPKVPLSPKCSFLSHLTLNH